MTAAVVRKFDCLDQDSEGLSLFDSYGFRDAFAALHLEPGKSFSSILRQHSDVCPSLCVCSFDAEGESYLPGAVNIHEMKKRSFNSRV